MITNLNKNKILWILVSLLSLIAALTGVINKSIYSKVISKEIMSGILSQDIITIFSAIIILLLITGIKKEDVTKQILIIGLVSYFFYGYGIYVIERVYNILYFLYMAIFGLSFYTVVYNVACISKEFLQKISVTKLLRYISIGFSILIPLIFYPLWMGQLLPLIKTGQKIEFFYSISILDLCFIMPAFLIIAFMTARKKGLGLLLTPAIFIHGFVLLFSVALGGIIKILSDQMANQGEILFFLILSLLFLGQALIYLSKLKITNEIKE